MSIPLAKYTDEMPLKPNKMKSKTMRLLVMLMAMLLIGGMMASCKKEIVKPAKLEKSIIGSWDQVGSNYGLSYATIYPGNGSTELILNEQEDFSHHYNNNGTTSRFTYRIENNLLYERNFNEVEQAPQSNEGSGQEFSMPHEDTLILDTKVYVRL